MTDFVPFKVTRSEAEMILRLFGNHVFGSGPFGSLTSAVFMRNIDELESPETRLPLEFHVGHSLWYNNIPCLIDGKDITSCVYAQAPKEGE